MKIQNTTIVVSFFCIWLSGYFSQQLQLISAFVLVFTFGILHGANDLVILNKMQGKIVLLSNFKLLFVYLMTILTMVCLFYLVPIVGLVIFVLISAYHFGEQHWLSKLKTDINGIKIFELIYGSFILLLLFQFHCNEVKKIVLEITNISITVYQITTTFKIVAVLLIVMTLYLFLKTSEIKKIIFLETFLLLIFTVIFKIASLMWGFAIYFVFWHSIPSLVEQVKYLHGNWNKQNFLLYCKSAVWYWVISLIGIAILFYFLENKKLFEALFFSFLAAITFPHVLVMLLMFQKKKVLNA